MKKILRFHTFLLSNRVICGILSFAGSIAKLVRHRTANPLPAVQVRVEPPSALVAQLDRVSDYESEGQEFESLRGHHSNSYI